jgi:hypothetical protein
MQMASGGHGRMNEQRHLIGRQPGKGKSTFILTEEAESEKTVGAGWHYYIGPVVCLYW